MPLENRRAEILKALSQAIDNSGIHPGGAHPCSYLPDRSSRELAFNAAHLPPGVYHTLMDLNFRRSGSIVYRPVCAMCAQCQAIRVPVAEFQPDRTQRRCVHKNRDISVSIESPCPTEEKYRLYLRYLEERHDRQMERSFEDFRSFLYASPVQTVEVLYRLDGALAGAAILDIEPNAASTVYCYYDPALPARSLGTFNILWTLQWAQAASIPWVYLGYYIHDSRKMNYKTRFRPCELLERDGNWRRV